MASSLQLTLRNAMGAALHAALVDIGVTTAPKPLYDYCHYRIFPLVVHDADAGMLPDNPQEWFQLQLQSELLKENSSSQDLAERGALKRAAELISEARLSPGDIAAMLTQAGTSQPAQPAAIVQLAAECLVLAMENQAWIREVSGWKTHIQAWRKAEKLCDNLQPLLPMIIRDSTSFDALANPDHPLTAHFRRRTERFRILRQVLEDLHFKNPPSGLLLQPPGGTTVPSGSRTRIAKASIPKPDGREVGPRCGSFSMRCAARILGPKSPARQSSCI